MSAPIFQQCFETRKYGGLPALAMNWRGAMMNIYCHGEQQVSATLDALHQAGFNLPESAWDDMAGKRLKTLRKALQDHDVGYGVSRMLETIDLWHAETFARGGFAHGQLSCGKQTVTLRWFRSGSRRQQQEVIGPLLPMQMLERLHKLDLLEQKLGSHLGQIRKRCADLAATSKFPPSQDAPQPPFESNQRL